MIHHKIIGIDIAKNIFQLHGASRRGKRLFSKRLKRIKLKSFMAQQSQRDINRHGGL